MNSPSTPTPARPAAGAATPDVAHLWRQAFAYAHCACPADEDGEVRYHSNCARKLRPILESLRTALDGTDCPTARLLEELANKVFGSGFGEPDEELRLRILSILSNHAH